MNRIQNLRLSYKSDVGEGAAHYITVAAFRARVCWGFLCYFAMTSGKRKMGPPRAVRRAPSMLERLRKVGAKIFTQPRTKRVAALFTLTELEQFDVLEYTYDTVEVRCGITSRMYGDYVGRMKIYRDGKLCITCECFDGCTADELTLREFEDHTKPPEGKSQWKRGFVWAFTKDGDRIPLHKTILLKYHKGSQYDACQVKRRRRTVHRNEFVKCTKCNKERRFLLRTEQECRLYHDAWISENWTCADFPFQGLSCEVDEERHTKKVLRGCPAKPLCNGCKSCVCFGCSICRFEDCNCRACVDFIKNAGTQKTNAGTQKTLARK